LRRPPDKPRFIAACPWNESHLRGPPTILTITGGNGMHAAAKVLAHTFVVHCGFACRRRLSGNNFMTATIDQNQAAAPSGLGVLLTSSLVSSLIMLDTNIVAVSLPAIGRSLGASFTDIQWVISAYVLTYASLLLRRATTPISTGERRRPSNAAPPWAESCWAAGKPTKKGLVTRRRVTSRSST